MKSLITCHLLLFILFQFSYISSAIEAKNTLIKVIFSFEDKPNPPYYLGKGSKINWKKPGITLELLKSMEKKLNIEVTFQRNPWKRGLVFLKNNRVNGVFHASFKAKRLEFGVYPMKDGKVNPNKRVMSNSYFLYKLKSSRLTWDGDMIRNNVRPVGASFGYAIVSDLRKMGIHVSEAYTQTASLRKLNKKYIDGFAGLETMVDLHLKMNPEEFKNIEKLYPPLKTKAYYVIFSHGFVSMNPNIAQGIWDEIENSKKSGEYDKIALKYLK